MRLLVYKKPIDFSASIERALDLPAGSWKKDKSPEMKALKKIIKFFPWMIHVADHSYDRDYADAAHIKAAMDMAGVDGLAEIIKGLRE